MKTSKTFILILLALSLLAGGAGIVHYKNKSKSASNISESKDNPQVAGTSLSPTPTPTGERINVDDGVLLNVPIIEQPEQFSCNVTAAAIVLQYKGVNVDPWAVYNGIPKQEVKKTGEFWGNPNLGYVGNIYGEFGGDKSDGYGVHWDPIQKYISQYRPAEVKHHWNTKEMLEEIDKGNPSILWWQNAFADPHPISWKSYDENGNVVDINSVYGMHSAVLVGYKGTPENPTEFIVSDPWADRWDNEYAHYNVKDFEYLWSFFNNLAVVVK